MQTLHQRTFQFAGIDADEVYSRLRETFVPLPDPRLLLDPVSSELIEWTSQGWQKDRHPCICKNGASGCPNYAVYIHAAPVGSLAERETQRTMLRITALPDLLVFIWTTIPFPRRWIPASVSIIALAVDVRIGEVPKFLLARGSDNQRPP